MNPWIVRFAVSPVLERLLSRPTFRYYRDLERSQWFSCQRLRELQLVKLQELVSVALNNTDTYADLAGVDRSWRLESLDDLQKLPLLDKANISTHRDGLVNRAVPGGPIRYNTGGSSGKPLIFYLDKRRQAYDKAARMRTHQWWGVRPGEKEAYIWGSPVELSKQDRIKNIRDWITNELLLSAFDLSEQSVGWFVERLRRFGPKCLFGYPSSISLMCQLARREGLDLTDLPVQVVFSTAEVLYDHQKEIISEALGGVPVVNGYGSREGGFIAHECPEGRMHITSENVIVEFIKDGEPVGPGQDGEIIVTHLDNYAMPFIRYQTGDIGQPSDETCPCGRGLEVMKVMKGRSTDFVVAPDGRWIHGLALIYVIRDIPGVRQYQIIQEDVDSIHVRVVLDDGFPANGLERIRDGITERIGAEVRVDVEQVSEIAQDPSGKFRHVISRVARDRSMALGLDGEE
ncbi:MAG: phenylacetate--CoA ligase family protein [Phycisphaerae bacterium]|nr:phenylacetate--CoA ligase family protein [Phycisphaerae bacterium]